MEYFKTRLTEVAIPNAQKILKFFRENKMPVFYAEFAAGATDSSDMLPLRKMADEASAKKTGASFVLHKDTREARTIDALKPQSGEIVVNKRTRNAFVGTGLDHTMRMMGIESVAVLGVCSDVCALATAIGASDLGYKTIILDDASATFTTTHDAMMRCFYTAFGSVMDSEDLIAALSKNLPKKAW